MGTTGPDIRLLTSADLDGAFGLSTGAGWNQRLADWRMLLQLAPAGSFAAGGRPDRRHRDRHRLRHVRLDRDDARGSGLARPGIGGQLLEEAIGAVPPELPIRLDATPLGRSLYERYGFQDEAELTRHVAEPSRLAGDPTCDLTARPVRGLTPVDLRSVIAQDDRVFGAHRRILLEWALLGAAHYAHVIDTDAGVQDCFGRPGRLFDQIGPVVAADDETARLLVGASLREAAGRAVIVDAYDGHDEFIEWLQTRGFYATRPLFRMRRPAAAAAGHAKRDPRPTR